MSTKRRSGSGAPEYTERMWMPWWWWLVGGFFVLSMILAVAAWVSSVAGILACLAIAGLSLWAGLAVGLTRISVDAEGFSVGPNRIEWQWVDRARGCDSRTMSTILHSGNQVGSFICTRPWIGSGVVLRLADRADPHPAWIVSSRRPDELTDAIRRHLGAVEERPTDITSEETR